MSNPEVEQNGMCKKQREGVRESGGSKGYKKYDYQIIVKLLGTILQNKNEIFQWLVIVFAMNMYCTFPKRKQDSLQINKMLKQNNPFSYKLRFLRTTLQQQFAKLIYSMSKRNHAEWIRIFFHQQITFF